MNLTLRSSSNLFTENERLRRKRLTTTTFNRFLSFNENKSSAAENRRRLLQKSEQNLFELLEDDDDDIDDTQCLSHECHTCSKIFASEYGLNNHMNMHHPNQSILCSICHITFRSHRSLKTHQQRRHTNQSTKFFLEKTHLPNYNYLSSYLILAFSSKQFPILAKYACEQQRLPLGEFSSQLYKCSVCSISFPCQRTLTYHIFNQHQQYQYDICQQLISNIIEQIEYNQRTVNNDNEHFQQIQYQFAQQATHFGLMNKQLAQQMRTYKFQQSQLIYPICQHEKRTCANLCLEYLSTYDQLTRNYSYEIPIQPKGSAFSQGSIVSLPLINTQYSLKINDINESNNNNNNNNNNNQRQKRKTLKQIVEIKQKNAMNNSKNNRIYSNNKMSNIKQHIEQTTNDSKIFIANPSSLLIQKKFASKDDNIYSSSMSSNSSTSIRSSIGKSSISSTNSNGQRSCKRSLSPLISNLSDKSTQKRRRTREQSTKNDSLSTIIRMNADELDIEQENDDDDDDDNDDDDDDDDDDANNIPLKFQRSKSRRSTKQRQASTSSIEYVQTLNNDQQLNNIENLKSKSKIIDEEIILCCSPTSANKIQTSSNKNHSKTSINDTNKSNGQQSPTNDEHVRVRCKICGEILQGRSRFSQHVITVHPNYLHKKLPDTKLQATAIVR